MQTKGILQLRFKGKEVTRADGPGLETGVAKSELSGMAEMRAKLRKSHSGEVKEEAAAPESLVSKLRRWFTVRFVITSILQLALRVLTGVFGILAAIKDAILNPRSAADVRAARNKNVA
jgi:hypothetical protein